MFRAIVTGVLTAVHRLGCRLASPYHSAGPEHLLKHKGKSRRLTIPGRREIRMRNPVNISSRRLDPPMGVFWPAIDHPQHTVGYFTMEDI